MTMWVSFVQMYIEADYVIFTKTLCDKVIYLNSPFFNVITSCQVRVVCSFCEINLLVSEGYLQHAVSASSENHLSKNTLFPPYILSGVRISDTTSRQVFIHLLLDGF